MTTIKNVRLKFKKLLGQTDKAIYLYLEDRSRHWIPKKLCRRLAVNGKMGGHVCIPSFLYQRMGKEPSMEIADITVTYHTPEKADKSLISYEDALFR